MSRSELVVRLPLIAPVQGEPETIAETPVSGEPFPLEVFISAALTIGFGQPKYHYAYVTGSWVSGSITWSISGPGTIMQAGDTLWVKTTGSGVLECTATVDGVEYSKTRFVVL